MSGPPSRRARDLRSHCCPELATLILRAGIGTVVNALLRPDDVARVLAVSKATVLRLARSRELASVRIGGQVRFRLEAVEEFLARWEAQAPHPLPVPVVAPRRGRPRKQWVRSAIVGQHSSLWRSPTLTHGRRA